MENSVSTFKPSKNSLAEKMEDMRKSCVEKILDDDFSNRDSMDGSMKITNKSGDSYAKINCNVAVKSNDGALEYKVNDDFEVSTKLNSFKMRGKIKGGRWTEHYDFGFKKMSSSQGEMFKNFWFNPYMTWGASRALSNWEHHAGLVMYPCANFSLRTQVNHDPSSAVDDNGAWSVCNKMRLDKDKFWMDWLCHVNMQNIKNCMIKSIRLGWNEDKWSMTAQANKLNFCQGSSLMDSMSLGFAWRCKKIGSMVGRFTHFMDDRPWNMEVGVQKKVCDKVTVKGKLDNQFNFTALCVSKCNDWMTVNTGFTTNLADSEKVTGIMDLPLKFGMKWKINK